MCPFTVRRLAWFGLVWFVCSICSPRTQTICGVIAPVTVNNHKFHSFPCALFTIQLQHRLHCNKRTVYSRFGYMNHYHLRTLVLCECLNPKQTFPPFWCIGFCISSDWLSHRERRHTITSTQIQWANQSRAIQTAWMATRLTIIGQMPSQAWAMIGTAKQ